MFTHKYKKITIKAFRFNAETDYLPYYKTYEMEVENHELILDLLNRIKWEHDGSFSYRRSCRHGICGSCSIKVNGKPVLACKENAWDMIDLFGDELIFDPQSKKRAIKDMIIDKKDFWEKHAAVKPFVVADVDPHPEHETKMSIAQVENFLDADYCIQCGNCHYACPALEVNEEFFGPAAFAAAYRFSIDPRDEAGKERLEMTSEPAQGVWDCVLDGGELRLRELWGEVAGDAAVLEALQLLLGELPHRARPLGRRRRHPLLGRVRRVGLVFACVVGRLARIVRRTRAAAIVP